MKKAAEDLDSGSPPRTRPRLRPTKPTLRHAEASGTGVSDSVAQTLKRAQAVKVQSITWADNDASMFENGADADEVIEEVEEVDETWDEISDEEDEEYEEVGEVKAKGTAPGM